MYLNRDSILQQCQYDADQHSAPPIQLRWINRKGVISSRWIFIRCCGRIGHVIDDVVVTLKSDRSPDEGCVNHKISSKAHHPGKLKLFRYSSNQVKQHTPSLAIWSCCHTAIDRWTAIWDGVGNVSSDIFDSGCEDGSWNLDAFDEDFDQPIDHSVALSARPLHGRKLRNSASSGNKSSGEQTVILDGDFHIHAHLIKPTQKSVKTSFSNGKLIFDVMSSIMKGDLSWETIPKIRVAQLMVGTRMLWYSIDNRRLLMLKAFHLEGMDFSCEKVQWSDEFTSKLKQDIYHELEEIESGERVWSHDIKQFRKMFSVYLLQKEDVDATFEPKSSSGYTLQFDIVKEIK